MREGKGKVVTTVIDKVEAAVKGGDLWSSSPNIFVLVDEGHRSVYGTKGGKMKQVLPQGCFIGFTGTPLMKGEKITAIEFGGFIEPAHTIHQPVTDVAVGASLSRSPLLTAQ